MAFHIPLALTGRIARSAQPLNSAGNNTIPLRQMSARSRQNAGGSLHQEGLSSQPAPPLRQQSVAPRQGGKSGPGGTLARLRERLQKGSASASKDNASLPTRTDEMVNSGQFTRAAARDKTPAEMTRPASSSAPPIPPRAAGHTLTPPPIPPRAPGHTLTPPPIPPKSPLRQSGLRQELATAALETLAQLPASEILQQARGQRPERPQPPMSEKARGKQPEHAARTAQRAASFHPAPGMNTIAEEKYAELELSKLNPMQQLALQAAEQDSAERKNQLRPQVASMALDASGKLSVTDSVSDNLRNILNETVASPRHRWHAHHASPDNSQHLLMDHNGRVFSLQGSKTAFIGLTQSVPLSDGQQDGASALARLTEPQTAAQHNMTMPGDAIHAQLTGIFSHQRKQGSTQTEEHIREHGGRLYRLDESKMHWDQVDKDEEKSFSKLTKQPGGMMFAVHDKKTLHNLSSGEKSEKFKEKITGYCTNPRGEALLLLSDEKTTQQSVKFLTELGAKKEAQQSITLKTPAGENSETFHATGIAMHDDQLLAIGSNGKLYRAAAPAAGDTEALLQEDSEITAQLASHFGEKFTLEGFLNNDDGSLLALVKDENNQKHACAQNANGVFLPQWNLSASLVMDHHEGLLQPRPLPQDIVDLGRLGQMMLHDGKVHAFNKNSQRWEASSESADSIKRGQDGQAYILKDGIPARVKNSIKSDSIGGVSNPFIMRQMKNNLATEPPLPGINSHNKASAIAPLDAERFVALTEKGELQFHRNQAGSRQPDKLVKTLSKDGIENYLPDTLAGTALSLPANGHGNTLTDIAMDQQQSLYALDKQGKLYTLPKEEWQTESATPAWQPVALPDGLTVLDSLHNVSDGSLMVADRDGRSAILQLAGTRLNANVKQGNTEPRPSGEPVTAPAVNNQNAQQIADTNRWLVQPDYDPEKKLEAKSHRRRVEKAWERLDTATKSTRVMGMTMKREVNLLGMTGRDGNHINSRLRDRLRAHVINPTLSTPRPVKNAGYMMQHSWQGREGLRPLYEHQASLHHQMKTLIAQHPPAQPRGNLMDRLEALKEKHFDQTLIDNLQQFSDGVTDSARHHASLLGQHSGALKADRTATEDFSPSRFTALSQAMNINSDDRNLVADLSALYQRYPMRAENDSHSLMDSLQQQGVVVRHQKPQPPMNRQRDPFDDMSLSKSRLILDGLTMSKLHDMVDEMERLADDPHAVATHSPDLQQRFRLLRDDTYGEDPVRKATSQGFVSNKQLEACYDAIKSMTKAFSKPHHGVSMTTRTVLKASNPQQMSERLHRTLTSLEPGENMGFGRNYGGQLTLSVIPGTEVIGIPGLRGNLDRAYNASFSRGDSGITVSFSRNGGGTGTAFGAVGWNPISMADGYENAKVDLGEQRTLTPSARLGGMLSMALQYQMQNSISFTISEADLESFIQQLTSGQLDPQELMDKGVGHRMKNGTTLTFNADSALMATAGGGVSLPTNSEDSKKNAATIRANVLAQAGANLASAQRDRNVTRSATGQTNDRSDNRMRFLNNASATLGIAGGMGITTNAADQLRIPMFGVSSTNIQVSIDNRTKQSMSLDMAKAEPVEQHQLDKLMEEIGKNFDDATLNALVQEIKDADDMPEKPDMSLPPAVQALKEQSLRDRAANPGTMRSLSKTERAALDKLPQPGSGSGMKAITAAGEYRAAPQPASDKLKTYMKEDKEAVKMKLDKLTRHLLSMTPANNGQYGVLNSAKQLTLQQQAADLHCQALNSAEYQTTYNNLHKIDSNNLMHVLHNLIASELPPSNAERISSFMEQKPMLKEVIRELQKHSDTQAVVTLEMKDSEKFRTQQLWLSHQTQPEDIQKLLQDRNNLRIKAITFTETNTKPEGITIPFFVTGGSSSASVSMSRNLGKINFSYGENQDTPHSFSLEGEIAYASENVVSALTNAEVQDKRGVV